MSRKWEHENGSKSACSEAGSSAGVSAWDGNEVRPVLNRVLNLLDVSFGNGQVTMLEPVCASVCLVLGQRSRRRVWTGACECVFSCSLLNGFVASCWGWDGNLPRAERNLCSGLVLGAVQCSSHLVEAFQCDTVLYLE